MKTGFVVITLAAAVSGGCGWTSRENLQASVTYSKDVAPLLSKYCVECHQHGGIAPFPLQTYEHAKSYKGSIVRAILSRHMPPFGADDTGLPIQNSLWMSDTEIDVFESWLAQGAERGENIAPLRPSRSPFVIENPSIEPKMAEPYQPNVTSERDEFRCFVLDATASEYSFLTAIDVIPGVKQQVHHAVIFQLDKEAQGNAEAADAQDPLPGYDCGSGMFFGSIVHVWAPGMGAVKFHPGTGVLIYPGTESSGKFLMQIHYSYYPGGPLPDQTKVQMAFGTQTPSRLITVSGINNVNFSIPACSAPPCAPHTSEHRVTYGSATRIYGIFPHMHRLGVQIQLNLTRNGQTTRLVNVPKYDFHWQRFYFLETPLDIAVGDELSISCTWVNNRNEVVTVGERTIDEMCLAFTYQEF